MVRDAIHGPHARPFVGYRPLGFAYPTDSCWITRFTQCTLAFQQLAFRWCNLTNTHPYAKLSINLYKLVAVALTPDDALPQ